MLPKISVITPSYNQGRFLEHCISSVLSQNYPHLEYIIIDGGSRDGSIEIIKKYERNISFWISEPDEGQSNALNKGFRLATGDLVAWLNADDFYLPGALMTVARAFQADPEASFYFGDGLRVDEAGRPKRGFSPNGQVKFNQTALVFGLNYILQPATFINRSCLAQINYLDSTLCYGMDSDLWIRLSQLASPAPISTRIAASREYANTKTATGSFERIEELRQIAKKHSGLPITPGILCYLMDTLYSLSIQREDIFPPSFQRAVEDFWGAAAKLLSNYGARPDGFPVASETLRGTMIGPITAKRDHMKIGIELRHVTLGSSGGIAQLLKGVLETLFKRYADEEFFLFCTIFNRGLLNWDTSNVRVITLPTVNFFSEIDRIAAEERIGVLFRSYPVNDDLKFPQSKQIFLIPDIQHEIFPEFFDPEILRARREAFNRALANAGAIGTISNYTKQTLLDYTKEEYRDIFLMEPALQHEHQQDDLHDLQMDECKHIASNDFFLYPANLWPHKNHRRVLQAFGLFLERTGRDISFIFTGNPEGWLSLHKEFPSLPIYHLGFVSSQTLALLYKRARALVFFSLYEGFGMPLLEAFNAGTPVICSNTTSLPEVGGKAVLTCSPTDIQAMSDLMEKMVTDDTLRAKLVAQGKRRLKFYSWEKAAKNLLEACYRVSKAHADSLSLFRTRFAQSTLPLVSIVTPSYNQGQFLRYTVESVLAQSYPNIEYIVIDGGSTDGSIDILKSYGNLFLWISEPDRGQADAVNKGFARSHGEIRGYLNSDDVLLPNAIEKVVAFFQRHPECDLVYGQADYINENDEITGTYDTSHYSFARLMQACNICQPAAFWCTRIVKKIGDFNDRLDYVMDYEYWLRIANAGGVIKYIEEKLAYSRLYPGTKTMSARNKIYQEIFAVCKEQGGYIDKNFVFGYWHHLFWERSGAWQTALRYLPMAYQMMVNLHHKWLNRGCLIDQVNGTVSWNLKRRVFNLVKSSPYLYEEARLGQIHKLTRLLKESEASREESLKHLQALKQILNSQPIKLMVRLRWRHLGLI
jgi:Glycosyltransferase